MKIILFRSPSDEYRDVLLQRNPSLKNADVSFVPVLVERLEPPNGKQMRDWLSRYSGFIYTSKRAVDAFALGYQAYYQEEFGDTTTTTTTTTTTIYPCYVVGPATANAFRSHPSLLMPQDPSKFVLLGENCGHADALVREIPRWHSEHHGRGEIQSNKPILFLCGDKRRDIIPQFFQNTKPCLQDTQIPIELEEQQVYATAPSPTLRNDLTAILSSPVVTSELSSLRLVFFSPSGVDVVWPCLLEFFKDSQNMEGLHFVAIGPTTAEHLQTKYHVSMSQLQVAKTPSPEGIAECLISCTH